MRHLCREDTSLEFRKRRSLRKARVVARRAIHTHHASLLLQSDCERVVIEIENEIEIEIEN